MKFELFYKSYCKKIFKTPEITMGLPWWLKWKRICLQCGRPGFDPWVRKMERKKGGEKKGRKAGGQFQCKSQVSWATSWSKKLNRIIMVFLILEFNFFQIVEALIKSKNHANTHTHTQSQMRNFIIFFFW